MTRFQAGSKYPAYIHQAEGGDRGCVIMPFAYSLAAHPATRDTFSKLLLLGSEPKALQALVLSFLDDLSVAG